jgi:hypothetical protein
MEPVTVDMLSELAVNPKHVFTGQPVSLLMVDHSSATY